MPTAILRPGAVETWAHSPSPPTIVGAPPQWADDSDATYATSEGTGGTVPTQPAAFIEPLPADAVSLSSATFHVRYSATAVGSNPFPAMQYTWWPDTSGYSWRKTLRDLVTGGAVTEASVFIYDPAWNDPAYANGTVLPELQAGGNLVFSSITATSNENQWDAVTTIYETWFEVVYEVAAGTLRQAPLRVVQRGNDGLGLSGGRRVTQTRTAQSSNRVIGIR